MLNPLSLQIYSPPDPGFHQQRYSDSEIDDLVSFDDETTVYSLPRQRNPFIDDQAEEVNASFIMSDSDSATIDSEIGTNSLHSKISESIITC